MFRNSPVLSCAVRLKLGPLLTWPITNGCTVVHFDVCLFIKCFHSSCLLPLGICCNDLSLYTRFSSSSLVFCEKTRSFLAVAFCHNPSCRNSGKSLVFGFFLKDWLLKKNSCSSMNLHKKFCPNSIWKCWMVVFVFEPFFTVPPPSPTFFLLLVSNRAPGKPLRLHVQESGPTVSVALKMLRVHEVLGPFLCNHPFLKSFMCGFTKSCVLHQQIIHYSSDLGSE